LGADHHTLSRIASLESATTDGSGIKSLKDGIEVKVASPDPRAARLREEWAHNPKLTKKWRPGTPGDFKRLRRHLAKYVHTPKILNGLTANIHKLATGEWPGKKAHTAKGNKGKGMNMGLHVKSIDWSGIEYKAAALFDDTDVAGLFDGVDGWGEVFDDPGASDYLAALEAADLTPDEPLSDGDTDMLVDTARLASIGARLVADPAPSTTDIPEPVSGTTTVEGGGEPARLFDAEPVST